MQQRSLIILLSAIFLLTTAPACTSIPIRNVVYFIPEGYEGWVNIIYLDSTYRNHFIKNGKNSELYFISGNPAKYQVSDKLPAFAEMRAEYYYYKCNGELIKLSKSAIGNIHFGSTSTFEEKPFLRRYYSFYVTKKKAYDSDTEAPINEPFAMR